MKRETTGDFMTFGEASQAGLNNLNRYEIPGNKVNYFQCHICEHPRIVEVKTDNEHGRPCSTTEVCLFCGCDLWPF